MPTVIIVANHRTGSGCLASVLHTMGVKMIPTAEPIHTGDMAWEDQTFVTLNRRIFNEVENDYSAWRYPAPVFDRQIIQDYRMSLLHRISVNQIWGFKDPRTVFVLDFVLGLLAGLGESPRLVWLSRDTEAVADSLRRRDDARYPTDHLAVAKHQRDAWNVAKAKHASSTNSVELTYEQMTKQPELVVPKLLHVMEPYYPTQDMINRATAKIRRRK